MIRTKQVALATFVVLFPILISALPALALDHSGSISSSETWSAADNPHNITAHVTVQAGVTLTIEDGVEIFTNSGRSINVYGQITALGTPENGIGFYQSSSSKWGGIGFYGNGTGTIENCLIDQANSGITSGTTATVTVKNTNITECGYGINANSGTTELWSVNVSGASSYGYYGNGQAPTFMDTNTVFENCSTGVYLTNVSGLDFSSPVTLRNNTTTGLNLTNCESPSIDNITVEGSTGTSGAIYLANCGEFTLGAGNNLGGSGVENSWPVTMDFASYPSTSCVIPTTGNSNNNIRVSGGTTNRTFTWPVLDGLDYYITAHCTINAGGEFIIPDGLNLYFSSGRVLHSYGQLTALGTPENGIGFYQSSSSKWGGIGFYGNGTGTIENCLIDQANSGITSGTTATVTVKNTNITECGYGINANSGTTELWSVNVSGASSYGYYGNGQAPTFMDTNTVFEDCSTGVYLIYVSDLDFSSPVTLRNNTTTGLNLTHCESPTIDNITVEGSTGTAGAIALTNCGEFILGAGNNLGGSGVENTWPVTMDFASYPSASCIIPTTGNNNNNIRVSGGTSGRTFTWPILEGLDYYITAHCTITAGGEFVIPDGLNLYFSSGRVLHSYGQLTALGTPENGIGFYQSSASKWGGIGFYGDGTGTLENCIIDQANSGITSGTTGTVTVKNTNITECGYGINANSGTTELWSVNVSGASSYGYYGNSQAPTFMDTNTVFENCSTGVYLTNVSGLEFSSPVTLRNNTTTGLNLTHCESPTIDNITVEGSTGTAGAIALTNCGEFTLGAGNNLGGSGVENTWPVTMDFASYPTASCVIPTTGNNNNNIRVSGGTSGRTFTWPVFESLDYYITAHCIISAGGEFIIPDGLNLYFSSGRVLQTYGQLTALGTPENGIGFHQSSSSIWGGIGFYGDGTGTIENCLIDHANSGIFMGSTGTITVKNTNITECGYGINANNGTTELWSVNVSGASSYGYYGNGQAPTFMDTNTVFDNCSTGVYLIYVSELDFSSPVTLRNNTTTGLNLTNCESPTIDNITVESCTGTAGAIALTNCGEFTIGAGNNLGGSGVENSWPVTMDFSSYPSASCVIPTTGNNNNNIHVSGGTSGRTFTWPVLEGLDYYITAHCIINAGGEFIIPDGLNLYFSSGRVLQTYGQLTALGTPENGIGFYQSSSSIWGGIGFYGDGAGTLENCNINHGNTGILLSTTGSVDVVGCTINEGGRGIQALSGNISFINSKIINNTSYGFYVTGGIVQFGSNLSEWNDIYGNGTPGNGQDYWNGANDVHAGWVHWGTMHQMEIWANTWDELDDEARGYIDFIPHSNAEHNNVISGVGDEDDDVPEVLLPTRTEMYQNHPNPFNPSTTISFDLHKEAAVHLEVFDISGARVTTLVHEYMAAGQHNIIWNGADDSGRSVSSGVYLYKIQAGDVSSTKRMMLVK